MKLTQEQEIALAGLFHDIGKVLQRTGIKPDELGVREYDYQNVLPRTGDHYTHYHALFTYLFLSRAKDQGLLPSFAGFDREDVNLIVISARHHNPSTVYDWIIAEADRISSGMDRKQYEEARTSHPSSGHHIMERLSPVFEEICLAKNRFDGFHYRYPLICMDPQAMFPEQAQAILPSDLSTAAGEYENLWNRLETSFEKVSELQPFSNYLEAVISILEYHFWAVPSATYSLGRKVWSDISLYDHLMTTAALAHTLFRYHKETGSLDEKSVRDREKEKYLFINLDLSGIQKYIFDITVDAAKGAARMLRARSFYLNILMEGTFRLLCSELGLYSINRLVDAGGRSIILAPNLDGYEQKLKELQAITDNFCLDRFQGELTVNLSWLPATGVDLHMDRFASFLGALNQKAQEVKLRKLSTVVGKKEGHLLGSFWEDYQPDKGLCRACGKKQALMSVDEAATVFYCQDCNRLSGLGSKIVSRRFLAYAAGNECPQDGLPVPGGYFFLSEQPLKGGAWELVWNIIQERDSTYAVKTIANYIPIFHESDRQNEVFTNLNTAEQTKEAKEGIRHGWPKTFHHISLSSLRPKADGSGYQGRPYLAVFKADVDNLGFLFGYGLRGHEGAEGNRLTLGRYTTFSRMMDRFFTIYLPHLMATDAEFKDTYTVFAGGDDLFLIGPWTKTFRLANRIYKDFRRYTCSNPDITMCGTLNLMKSKHPVNYISRVAEQGLDKAKMESDAKDSLHLWGEVLSWSRFPSIVKLKDELDRLINDPKSKVSRGLVYDFLTLKEMKKGFLEKRVLKCGAYASLFRYKLGRLAKEKMSPEVQDTLIEVYRDYIEGEEPLHLAVQWALYLNRG
ncbi:MAG: type III-A CRISPR-associated protein Cas10/Csm1 [Deltaproteobacteria bacterium]|nr:type III-A CRISPR-associated protein Cas10/Csm1 [Deltaproteobacteria bacterium]MBW2066683.1 type III-A CRISPR-associated protein Cas10/Csm1 [Deltaproteobacteria bacterium]